MTRLTLGLRAACVNLAFVLLGALAVGCSTDKTVVFVTVTGDATGISQLKVDLTTVGLATTFFIPSPPPAELFSLPTTFTVEMDRSRQGDLTVEIEARDTGGVKLASGSAILTNIDVGHRNDLTVALMTDLPPGGGDDGGTGGDAGVDAGADAPGGEAAAETRLDVDGGAPEVVDSDDAGDDGGGDGTDDVGAEAGDDSSPEAGEDTGV